MKSLRLRWDLRLGSGRGQYAKLKDRQGQEDGSAEAANERWAQKGWRECIVVRSHKETVRQRGLNQLEPRGLRL